MDLSKILYFFDDVHTRTTSANCSLVVGVQRELASGGRGRVEALRPALLELLKMCDDDLMRRDAVALDRVEVAR